MTSLRVRLFASMLGALAVTLALTIAIGAVLTRRQVDRSQAVALARRADDLAFQRRTNVNYNREDALSGSVRILIQPRLKLSAFVTDVSRSSDGETTVGGRRQLYAYRTLPHLGLLLLRPANLRTAEWRPFLRDLLLAALAGAALAAVVSFLLARSIARPIRRVALATRALAADESHEPLPEEGSRELVSLANAFNEMAQQLAESRDAERAFLLSVSHELKTPLTAIRGYAEGLADGAFGPEEAARTIGAEAQRLERLVRDLLDLARMRRSEFAVHREPVDLFEVARETVVRHDATAVQFGVVLAAEGRESWVEADHGRLLQVAANLVENALRATPAGGTVTVTASGLDLVVADTGPGIGADDIPHAFERFYLYDKLGRERSVGSGLGLAIVDQLVRAMGGTVRVESAPGRGTTFTVSLRPEVRRVDDLEVGTGHTAERV